MTPAPVYRLPRFWWGLAFTALAIVTVASLVPLPPDLPSPPGEDLTLHLIAWALLALSFVALTRTAAWPAIGLWLYSVLLEGAQGTLTHRSAEGFDAIANGVGVVIGALLAVTLGRRVLAYVDGRLSALIASMRA